MKIRMLTFHTPKNHGAVLQAYALQTHLKKICDDVKILNFCPSSLLKKYDLYFPATKSWFAFAKKCARLPFLLFWSHHYHRLRTSRKNFESFAARYFDLTERYASLEEMEKKFPDCDIVITGSDQIFNPERQPFEEHRAFYLDFDTRDALRASYAGSFGVSTIPEHCKGRIASFLNRFDALSVREDSGKVFVETLTPKNAVVSLDPVFLLEKSEWEVLAQQANEKITGNINRPYLLYYSLLNFKGSNEHVQRIARQYGLEIVVISHSACLHIKADRVIRDAGPLEFLKLMLNAEYIMTDSFHGTAFAILMKKPLNYYHEVERRMLRSRQVLGYLGLGQRVISPILSHTPDDSMMSYTKEISDKLLSLRQRSMDYLNDLLEMRINNP